MKAAKIDRSGIFDHVKSALTRPPEPIREFQVSDLGMTFHSPTRISPWTEMEVEVELPSGKNRRILCRGVVVQCEMAPHAHGGYDVTMFFMDVNKRTLAEMQKASVQFTHWVIPQPNAKSPGARA